MDLVSVSVYLLTAFGERYPVTVLVLVSLSVSVYLFTAYGTRYPVTVLVLASVSVLVSVTFFIWPNPF